VVINPDVNIEPFLDKVGPDSEEKFNESFFTSLDVAVNALDNVQARMYVDSRCITYSKPLLESGTMGTKGHVQVIIPFKTESYTSQFDPVETSTPFCTIKSFPSNMDHCIQWARDKFESLFVTKPRELQKFFSDTEQYVKRIRSVGGPSMATLKFLLKILKNKPRSIEVCIDYAIKRFHSYYNISILQLLHAFPEDLKMKDGSLFWSLPKRPPNPLFF